MIPLSVLDLAPMPEGSNAAEALRRSLDLAQHAERWGYRRFWLAEHHSMPGIASAATSVVIAHVAGGTSRIRVGAGGIDLGVGRAPGTDQMTVRALRRSPASAESFPQ
jgi:alkanesulfonate monooxygenase SsuD/methylene tetrahydromethanopterin reductase-like flavin-dependent oxidoreductase (luciferase family)